METLAVGPAWLIRHAPIMTLVNPTPRDEDVWRLRSIADATELFARELSHLRREELRVVHLDDQGGVLGLSAAMVDDPDTIELPVREIMRDALQLGARALILAHNHPSGDATPSAADKQATRRLAHAAGTLGVRLLDHLIFAGDECRSFRQMGLL